MDTVCKIQSLFFQNLVLLALLPPPFIPSVHSTTASAPHTTAPAGPGRAAATCVALDSVPDNPDGSCNSGRNYRGQGRSLLHRFIRIRHLDDRSLLANACACGAAGAAANIDLCRIRHGYCSHRAYVHAQSTPYAERFIDLVFHCFSSSILFLICSSCPSSIAA